MCLSPLEHEWALYVHFPHYGHTASEASYASQAYRLLTTFHTVQDFWSCLDKLVQTPSHVFFTTSSPRVQMEDRDVEAYGLFKVGVRPEWEDVLNRRGGHWESRKAWTPEQLDNVWVHLAMAVVGEGLEEYRDITGMRLVDKSRPPHKADYRIEVWTSTSDTVRNEAIRDKLVNELKEVDEMQFVWKSHAESIDACIVKDVVKT